MANQLSATSRPEHIATIQLTTTNTAYQLPTQGGQLPNDRYMWGLWLRFVGRLTMGATPANTATVDNLLALCNRVKVGGIHRVRGQREDFVDMYGPDLYNWQAIYQGVAPYWTGTVNVAASATTDFEFSIPVWFVPGAVALKEQLGFILDAPNYDNLQLTIYWGDPNSVTQITPSGLPPAGMTLSAYGSTTGNPICEVSGMYALAGDSRFRGYIPGRVFRYTVAERTSGDIVNGAVGSRLFEIPRGYRIRALMLKTGLLASGVSSGNHAYANLQGGVFTNLRVQRGINRSIRIYRRQSDIASDVQGMYRYNPQLGYSLVDFAGRGSVKESLDTTGLIAGPSGDTDLYVQSDITPAISPPPAGTLGGPGTPAALLQVEELRFSPYNVFAGA